MKIKHFKRILCFLLAVVVLLSMPLDTTAHAVAVELGWVTWALISYLTAVGFTFAVTGGIEALQAEVEEKVDEYYTFTGINLLQTIAYHLKLKMGGNGNGNGFWFGVAAVTAIADFIKWVRENGWSAGTNVNNSISEIKINAVQYKNSVSQNIQIDNTYFEKTSISNVYTPVKMGTVYSWVELDVAKQNSIVTDGILFDYTTTGQKSGFNLYWYDAAQTKIYLYRVINNSNYGSSINVTSLLNSAGYSNENIVSYTFSCTNGEQELGSVIRLLAVLDDGKLLDLSYVGFNNNTAKQQTITSVINVPQETNDFEVNETELVEVDFSVFENDETFTEPEELAEAVKQQIVDTGTVPTIKTEVITDPDTLPEPTPAPTPVPSPEIEDIEDLGLPTLGEALFNKFPFSLPRDLKRIADILNAEPVAPFWEVDLFAPLADDIAFQGDTTLRIDLTEYEVLGQISRWASVIGFCIMLIIITKGVIKW